MRRTLSFLGDLGGTLFLASAITLALLVAQGAYRIERS